METPKLCKVDLMSHILLEAVLHIANKCIVPRFASRILEHKTRQNYLIELQSQED